VSLGHRNPATAGFAGRGTMRAMEWLIIILLLVLIALIAFLLFRKPATPQESQSLILLQNQLQDLSRLMGEGSNRMSENMRTQTSETQRLMSDITEKVSRQLLEVVKGVTETKESTKQVFTIAEQLQNLEKVLKHQKQRGNLGEASLELILGNILPPGSYKMQHEFPGGETVDAVIVTKEGVIPIDAKFSLDNYQRLVNAIDDRQREELEKQFKNDLKMRIDECAKYVRVKDGTLPFAFMYIPAEAIYYDLLINEVGSVKVNTRNLIDYAYNEKKVIIVSPTTFAAYLQSVLYGFKAFKIEETAKDIAKNVENLSRHLKAYEDYYKKLGSSLSTTVNHFNAGSKELGKIDKDVLRITGESSGLEIGLLEKPQTGE
jgi:DNA recombination protein RmuC